MVSSEARSTSSQDRIYTASTNKDFFRNIYIYTLIAKMYIQYICIFNTKQQTFFLSVGYSIGSSWARISKWAAFKGSMSQLVNLLFSKGVKYVQIFNQEKILRFQPWISCVIKKNRGAKSCRPTAIWGSDWHDDCLSPPVLFTQRNSAA